jgi:hypothetical protein
MQKKFWSVTTGLIGVLMWASAANASTITIGLQQTGFNGGAITPVAVGIGSASIQNLAYGTFNANSVSVTGNPILPLPDILDSSSLNVLTISVGTLTVYVTSQNNHDTANAWLSSFTSNQVPTGWTVTEKTYLDPGNGLFSTAILLGSSVFNAQGVSSNTALAFSGTNYSLTEVYTIESSGRGVANSTIDLSIAAVPGPIAGAGLPGLLAAGAAFIAWMRRQSLMRQK